jgi:uncharacterized membrane protein YfcA
MLSIWGFIVISTAGVLAGTLFGTRVLRKIPEQIFQRIVSAIILALGVFMLWRAIHGQ